MAEGTSDTAKAASAPRAWSTTWAGYAACTWAFAFAVPSLYWSLGGTAGVETTLSPELVQLARDRVPWFVTFLWITFLLKVFAGVLSASKLRLNLYSSQ